MTYRNVDAGRGVEWLKRSVQLLLANPAPFLLMGLLFAVVSAVPVLGGLALLVLGPALYAGFMVAARTQQQGGKPEFTQLFAAFQEEGKLPKMLALCLPAVGAVVVLAVLGGILLGGALIGAAMSPSGGTSQGIALAAFGGAGIVFVLIALAVAFVAHALVFFATPRVMFDGIEPFPAMKESWSAVLANIGAVLLFLVLVLVAYVVLAVIFGNISGLLLQLVVGVVVAPVIAVSIYFAYGDVFGGAGSEALTMDPPHEPAPPHGPPTPPPPAGPPSPGAPPPTM